MASYKVPQDVEAEDKLIGPFSFRQFIYLIIVALGIFMAWGLSRLFIGLFILPLPIVFFFAVLALPLKKDQPMEIYLAALVNYYLKPRLHLWDPAPPATNVIITAPHVETVQRTKGLSTEEVNRRLGYLSQVVDTHGWSTRGVTGPAQNSSMNDELYFEAQSTQDVMDEQGTVRRGLDSMLEKAAMTYKKQMLEAIQNSNIASAQPQNPNNYAIPQNNQQLYIQPQQTNPQQPPQVQLRGATPALRASPRPQEDIVPQHLKINPYPSGMHQSVIQPSFAQSDAPRNTTQQPAPEPVKSTSETSVSPDIMELANNNDISVETMARQAKRLEAKKQGEEVVISLR